MTKVSAIDFQLFLLKLGFKRFLEGFYYFKWLEYPLVYNNLEVRQGERCLDIGSGNSIFPLFLLNRNDCIVYIIDDQSIIKNVIDYYKKAINKIGLIEELEKRFFLNIATKGSEWNLPDEYFDKISCISTIEHIMHEGDSLMMKTISRLLKKGGTAVVSFPFNNMYFIEEDNPENVGYFQRQYNINAIKNRIIDPSHLNIKRAIFFGERYINFGKLYRRNKFTKIKWLLPFLHFLFWRIVYTYEGEFRNHNMSRIDKKGAGVACIVFEKL